MPTAEELRKITVPELKQLILTGDKITARVVTPADAGYTSGYFADSAPIGVNVAVPTPEMWTDIHPIDPSTQKTDTTEPNLWDRFLQNFKDSTIKGIFPFTSVFESLGELLQGKNMFTNDPMAKPNTEVKMDDFSFMGFTGIMAFIVLMWFMNNFK